MPPAFSIKIPGYTFEHSRTLPEEHKEYYLPGSDIHAAVGSFGKISVQKIILEEYHLYYAVLTVEQEITVLVYYPEPLCCLLMVLQGTFEAVIQGVGKTIFQQHTCSIGYHPRWQLNSTFAKGHAILLVIGMPPVILRSVLLFYPALEPFQQHIENNQPALLQGTAQAFTPPFTERIDQLLQVPVLPLTRWFHLNNVQAIIKEICKPLNEAAVKEPYFSLDDMDIIHATKKFIDTHLDTHYTIPELAKTMGINEYKLKKGFKALTGMGVFGYLRRQRLAIAKTKLEQTNKTVEEIASLAGYKSSANFCTAFRKRYGITPQALKKKRKR